MQYCSIDIETTGLNPRTCDVIEVGAVIDDLKDPKPLEDLPTFHCYVLPFDDDIYTGEPYALSMHGEIFKRIATKVPKYDYLKPEEVGPAMLAWFQGNNIEGRITPAGKNFASFDKQFLERLPNFVENISFNHRTIDPAMLYWRPEEDVKLPDQNTCLERAKISEEVSHTALEDALQVVKLLRVNVFGDVDPKK